MGAVNATLGNSNSNDTSTMGASGSGSAGTSLDANADMQSGSSDDLLQPRADRG